MPGQVRVGVELEPRREHEVAQVRARVRQVDALVGGRGAHLTVLLGLGLPQLEHAAEYGDPAAVGAQQEHKGEVLDKLYMKVTPTVVLWDGRPDAAAEADDEKREGEGSEDEDEEDVWDNMEDVDSEDEGAKRKKSKSK